jgi:hypothetical protein
MIYGQGLYASSKPWDGTITIEESIPEMHISNYADASLIPFTEMVNAHIDESVADVITQQVQEMGITNISMTLIPAYDHASPSEIIKQLTLDTTEGHMGTYDTDYVRINTNNEYVLIESYMYEGVAQSIDEGSLTVATIDTSVFASIESIEET